MNAVLSLYRTTIGKKVVMAVTGSIMAGWLVVHMAGNLQVFLGAETFNHYAELLQSQKELLWIMRITMLTMLALHIWSVVALVRVGAMARRTPYAGGKASLASTLASKSLRIGGVGILVFLVFHLADLTIGVPAVHPTFVKHDAFANLTNSLARPGVALLYIVANLFLALHLHHGLYSVFQTLGLNHIQGRDTARQVATLIAGLVAGGNILIALSILLGLVGASA